MTQLSDDTPVYQEQAAFTPDMREVIFMSNRDASSGSWYDQVVAAGQRTGFDAPLAGSTGTLQFLADFSDPRFRSDLFMLDVRTHDLRELTASHNVIPEFHFDRSGTRVLWSGVVGLPNRNFVTRVGRFESLSVRERRTPKSIPAPGLYGQPVDMARLRPAPSISVTVGAPAAVTPAARAAVAADAPDGLGAPVRTSGRDHQTIPTVVGTYFSLWLGQLTALGHRSGIDLASVGFLSGALG